MDERARHKQLMGLFDTLCEAPTGERQLRLAALRINDPRLAETLQAMLAGDALQSPLDAPVQQLIDAAAPTLPERYRDLGPLGAGGMGEVRRVFDTELNRTLAMKIIGAGARPFEARFLAEAQVVAQLQHPSIVPVHALGWLDDGRCYFTMREVQGRTLAELLGERAHPGEGLRDHVYQLRQVAQAVAYAHDQGIIHRDLKPGNVMVGPFGDVMVLDWGLARRLEGSRILPSPGGVITPGGVVMGSPGFMAPEQAMGLRQQIGPATDVFALGAILFMILTGRAPLDATADPTAALAGPPPIDGPGLPAVLVDLCRHALAADTDERPAHAGLFADALSAWLTGAADRERARAVLTDAAADQARFGALRTEATALRRQAQAILLVLPPHAPLAAKLPGWALEDQAIAREREARAVEARWLQQVHAALNLAPDLPEAHALLADHHRALADAARARGDAAVAEEHRRVVEQHDDGRHARWLAGVGQVVIESDPPGATVAIARWQITARRSAPGPWTALGETPLHSDDLPAADYLLRLTHPQRVTVDHPVRLTPEATASAHIALPDRLPPATCYVPAGPFVVGGDPEAPDGFRAAVVEVPGFVIARDPVTNAEYVEFLNDLVARGEADVAEMHAPQLPFGGGTGDLMGRDDAGRFVLDPTAAGWRADAPVVQITWHAAMAYCAWRAERSGLPWRLLHEVEWEKAARGADGRAYPWGDHFDPVFACTVQSLPDPARQPVDAFASDVSPYGVRGMGGNVRDWCLNLWAAEPPASPLAPVAEVGDGMRATRGGSYISLAPMCRAATRFASLPDQHYNSVGFRMGFSWRG